MAGRADANVSTHAIARMVVASVLSIVPVSITIFKTSFYAQRADCCADYSIHMHSDFIVSPFQCFSVQLILQFNRSDILHDKEQQRRVSFFAQQYSHHESQNVLACSAAVPHW